MALDRFLVYDRRTVVGRQKVWIVIEIVIFGRVQLNKLGLSSQRSPMSPMAVPQESAPTTTKKWSRATTIQRPGTRMKLEINASKVCRTISSRRTTNKSWSIENISLKNSTTSSLKKPDTSVRKKNSVAISLKQNDTGVLRKSINRSNMNARKPYIAKRTKLSVKRIFNASGNGVIMTKNGSNSRKLIVPRDQTRVSEPRDRKQFVLYGLVELY